MTPPSIRSHRSTQEQPRIRSSPSITPETAPLLFPLTYHGKKLYPPQIKDLSRATSEGRPFAPVFLDTCVTITDPAIVDKTAFARDSIRWEIRDSSGLLLSYDLNTHLFTIPFPADSAFYGTIKLTLKVFVTNSPTTLYDAKQPSFFVTQANFPPVITLASDQCFKAFKTDTIFLDTITTAHDPNDALSSLNWSFFEGQSFQSGFAVYSRLLPKVSVSAGLPVVNPIIPILFFTRHIVIDAISAADTSYYGTDSLTFTVKDPGGSLPQEDLLYTPNRVLPVSPLARTLVQKKRLVPRCRGVIAVFLRFGDAPLLRRAFFLSAPVMTDLEFV